jgi:hypothetical protein
MLKQHCAILLEVCCQSNCCSSLLACWVGAYAPAAAQNSSCTPHPDPWGNHMHLLLLWLLFCCCCCCSRCFCCCYCYWCAFRTHNTACVCHVLLPALTCTPGSPPAWRLRPFSARGSSSSSTNHTRCKVCLSRCMPSISTALCALTSIVTCVAP